MKRKIQSLLVSSVIIISLNAFFPGNLMNRSSLTALKTSCDTTFSYEYAQSNTLSDVVDPPIKG